MFIGTPINPISSSSRKESIDFGMGSDSELSDTESSAGISYDRQGNHYT
jgi:hypothetical protein